MNQADWTGQPLGSNHLALAVSTAAVGSPLTLAASTGGRRYTVRPGQVGEFLRAHGGATFVCHDVGSVFWAVFDHLNRGSEGVALGVLWRLARSGRLHDIRLLDQLVRAAEHPSRPRAELRGVLAARHLGVAYAEEPTLQAQADAVSGIYLALREAADRIVERRGVGAGVVERFGPLTLGLQVRGSIALAAAGRNGLGVDVRVGQDVVRACDAAVAKSLDVLWRDPEARRCFKRDGEGPALTRTGFPKFKERTLEVWLRSVARALVCLHAIPFTPPTTPDGRTSTDPSEWGAWTGLHPLLNAWADLSAASGLRHAFGPPGKRAVHPVYQLIPTVRSVGPDLGHLRRLFGGQVFRPRPGHAFFVLTLRDLETRALAVAVERRSGRAGPGRLAELFRQGDDPIVHATASLLLMGRDSFDALKDSSPDLHSAALGFAGVLLSYAPRGIEPGLLRNRERGEEDQPPFAIKYPVAIDMSGPGAAARLYSESSG